jgi:outer membrane protein OmpA-like peptidoglycan-associated protein
LIQQFKVLEEHIKATGYGSSRPIVMQEETEEHKQLNRRVEFEIVKE